jgi:hypothetical protein
MLTQDRIQREIYESREKARRDAEDWKSALQRAEERVQNSFTRGSLIGQIRLCEELLGRTSSPEAELAAMSPDALRELAEQLRGELMGRT